MTDGVTLSGAWTVPYASVAVEIAGLDCGNFVVGNDGTIFVPFGSDPDGLLTPGYLRSVSNRFSSDPSLAALVLTDSDSDTVTVYVQVVAGYVYSSTGTLLRPSAESQIKSGLGAGVGKTRRAHWAGVLFQSAQGVSMGGATLRDLILTDAGGTETTKSILFTGVLATPIDDDYGYDSGITWQITRPYPCTVVSVNTFIETSER